MSFSRLLLIVSSLGILLLAACATRGIFIPRVGVVALLGLFYFALLIAGALLPQWEMYGEVLWRVPEAEGRVALSFDDGPDPRTTPRVLDLLKERGARATFFVLGARAEAHPELLRRMVEEGHAVGLHSYDHNRLYAFLPPKEVARDIEKCRAIVERACGVRPHWFRPPVGQMSPRTAEGVKRAGAQIVAWSVRGRDGLQRTSPEEVVTRVARGLRAGAIVLLHDAWERPEENPGREPSSLSALAPLLDELQRRGLQSVTVDELVLATLPAPELGKTTTKRAPGE